MKPSSWDKQLGLASPLECAASQSGQTNNPSKECGGAGCKSLYPHLPEGRGEAFFLDILFHRMSDIAILRQLTKRDQVADFVDLKGLTAEKILLVPNQKEFHLSSTAARCRLLSRRFMTFPAFSGFTPTCSRAARKCFRNRSKCTSFRPLSLDRAWAS